MTVYIGVDIGKKGGISIIQETSIVVIDMPLKDNEICWNTVYYELSKFDGEPVVCTVETQFMNPATGKQEGGFQCICDLLDIHFLAVTSVKWKKYFGLSKRKQDSVEYVEKHFPDIKVRGPRDGGKDGRADAILIGIYGKHYMEEEL